MLDNPLSHAVMEKITVSLKNSLHDKSEMVRAVFLDLLIKMKEVRAAKVDCVPIVSVKRHHSLKFHTNKLVSVDVLSLPVLGCVHCGAPAGPPGN